MAENYTNGVVFQTRILPVNTSDLGHFQDPKTLQTWQLPTDTASLKPLKEAAEHLKNSSIPVGFPTETVYGLGADATRSDAVKGIYKAKGRPSDNPLIIHVCDLTMLRDLIVPPGQLNGNAKSADPIPTIYKPLIERFWPGPLTILLPNPKSSKLAPEVTAGLSTFGARMPDSPLALSLIHLAGVPLAAPSANASTKPSPTTAEHVLHDLQGRIEIILDGGPCLVGVESTVVDGLCDPPVVLRPGGISIDRIRECEGWSGVVRGYKDQSEIGTSAPRAPGMKYKHYSPKAKVVLSETSPGRVEECTQKPGISLEVWKLIGAKEKKVDYLGLESLKRPIKIGIVSTKFWRECAGFHGAKVSQDNQSFFVSVTRYTNLETDNSFAMYQGELWQHELNFNLKTGKDEYAIESQLADIIEIRLGKDTKDIAHGLFSALRELDKRGTDIIYVEGIEDEGDIAAAVMNRLRKAASVIEKQ
jgi:L-threonylcarbamoyladenylate synthase